MSRFFISSQELQAGCVSEQTARHMTVLRLRPGDIVTLTAGDGWDYRCRITELNAGQVCFCTEDIVENHTEPMLRVSIFAAYAKADKFEHIIQKATELGAAAVVAFASQRCVARPDEASLRKKLTRWRTIALAASEQSGRGRIPEISAASSWQEALRLASRAELGLFFYENEQTNHISSLITPTPKTISIITGPEGGFSPQEVSQAQAAGLHPCSLGPRILRCETAPLCALTAVMYAAGEL